MKNIKTGKITDYRQYSQFSSLTEFNTHIEMWLLEHKHTLIKSELVALKRLVRYSAKLPGICNAKIGTILKAIHDEHKALGISRSSFKRMILKAKKLGILTVHVTERKNGAQSSNLYIFNRFPQNEPPKQQKMNQPNKTINPIKTNHKNINKRKEERFIILDYTFTSDRVPKSFVDWVKIYFNDSKTIEEFWRMATIAAYKFNRENDQELVLTLAIASFKQLIRKLKTAKTIKSPIGYFYGTLYRKLEELYFEDLDEMLNSPEVEEEDIFLDTIPKNELLNTFHKWLESP